MKKQIFLKWFIFSIAVAINLFILINAFINGEASAKESNSIAQSAADVINTVKPETITPQNFDRFAFDLRKAVGHFGLFLVDGVFTSWSIYLASAYIKKYKQWYGLIFTLFFGLFMAGLSEFIQIFVPGRSGELLDILIDYGGYLLGTGTIVLIAFLRYKKTKD